MTTIPHPLHSRRPMAAALLTLLALAPGLNAQPLQTPAANGSDGTRAFYVSPLGQ